MAPARERKTIRFSPDAAARSGPPGDNEPVTGPSDHDQRRGIRRLMVSRALDGVAALCPACHHDVPGVDGVVLTTFVAYAGWIILTDSGPNGDRLEDLHATLGEGPRADVVATGRLVTYADLTHAQAHARWPRFAVQALASGIRAVFAFPVQLDAKTVGVLSVYRATAGTGRPAGYTTGLPSGTCTDSDGSSRKPEAKSPIRATSSPQARCGSSRRFR